MVQYRCYLYTKIIILLLLSGLFPSFSFHVVPSLSSRSTLNQHQIIKATKSTTSDDGIKNDNTVFEIIKNAKVVNPSSNTICTALDGLDSSGTFDPMLSVQQLLGIKGSYDYLLVIVMPQLGDFDSAEYAELLSAVKQDLQYNKIALRIIGIGDATSAKRFAEFSKLSLDEIRVTNDGSIHEALNLHRGPDWDIPSFIPNSVLEWFADYCGAKASSDGSRDVNAIARSWLNYMAMCAGIYAPSTLPEILRGYFGDKEAPERLRENDIVNVPALNGESDQEPFIKIKGVTDVKLGPIEYQSIWKDEKGYQRPAELATVRLRFMVEVLSNFGTYVPDQRFLDYRGATYLFGGEMKNQLIYKHIDTGVLSYSETMKRPLSFLQKYIGEKALNPLELGDPAN